MARSPHPKLPSTPSAKRCAIYTRKSTSSGLEQEFNSLDAQRDACEHYIRSQAHQGWRSLDTRYDDGGFTGKNIERPAMQQLLQDVQDRKVDVVVVYKLDRLCRSLLDFARVMELFNRVGCEFVAVTQNFSTADAIGRLTLNILMSFAEFEREMIAERTRDKIVATRRKGKWTGGPVPLGYRVEDKRLVVEEFEAGIVRDAFEAFLAHQQTATVAREMNRRQRLAGPGRGPRCWTKDLVARLLRNPVYAGLVRCGEEVVAGEHQPILSQEVFYRAQALLDRRRSGVRHGNNPDYILRGLLRCAGCGGAFTPGSTRKGGREYRYYRCATRDKHGPERCSAPPLPAATIETFVAERVGSVAANTATVDELLQGLRQRVASRREHLTEERKRLPAAIGALSASMNSKMTALANLTGRARAEAEAHLPQDGQELDRLEGRLREVERELARLGEQDATADWVSEMLGNFPRIWNALIPANRARLLAALVDRIEVNGETGCVEIYLQTGAAEPSETPAAGEPA